jgi:hypothetical protein
VTTQQCAVVAAQSVQHLVDARDVVVAAAQERKQTLDGLCAQQPQAVEIGADGGVTRVAVPLLRHRFDVDGAVKVISELCLISIVSIE